MRFDIESYLESRLSKLKTSGSGKHSGELTAECPSCGKWGSFYVNHETGKFVCFSCEFRGRSIVGLVAELEGLSYSEAQAYVFKRAVPLRRRYKLLTLTERMRGLMGRESEEEPTTHGAELPEGFTPCYHDGAWKLPGYLKERGIRSKTARAWGMGFVRSVSIVEGRTLRGMRLVIPIDCPNGTSWTARAMDGAEPKYFNPAGADHSRLLIGWNVARLTGDLVICEGPVDAVMLYQHDISALALGGKVLHDAQLAMLLALPAATAVTVMLDPEERTAPMEVARALSTHFDAVFIARLPSSGAGLRAGKVDPGNATREQAYRAIERAQKWTGGRSLRVRAKLEASRAAMT